MDEDEEEASDEFRPPYMSFQTFWTFINYMADKPLPPRIDRTLMLSKSGSDQAGLASALCAFGLTDTKGTVQPALTALVAMGPEEHKVALGNLVREYYSAPMQLSAKNGTTGELNEVFLNSYSGMGASDTRRKAITFFLHAARTAGIALSPHFPSTRAGAGGPGTSKPRRSPGKRKPSTPPSGDQSQAPRNGSGHTQTVALNSGGTVTLIYDVNLFEMDETDEAYVLGLGKVTA